MKKYPSKGDGGRSERPEGAWAGKEDVWFEAIGTLDELSSALGWARSACGPESDLSGGLLRVQDDLLNLGAVLGGWRDESQVELTTDRMERDMSVWCGKLEPLKGFILSSGCELACRLHLARTICRRAERRVSALAAHGPKPVPATISRYMNRLSDWLFTAARWANFQAGIMEFRHEQRRES